jgi:hypothetical protein
MKLSEKVIISAAILVGCAGIILFLAIALGSGAEKKELALSVFKAPAESEALVTYTSGDVFIFRDNNWKTVEIGGLLKANDYIETFNNSFCDVQVGDRLIFSVQENTVVRLWEVLQASDKIQSECEVLVGSLLCKVEKLAGSEKVQVRTGSRLFAVRGTEFLVVRQNGEIACAVKGGRVAVVRSKDGTVESLVATGQAVQIDEATGRVGSLIGLSAARFIMLEKLSSVKYINTAKEEEAKLVKIAFEVSPGDAAIYIEGKLVGYGSYAGIYTAGTQLPITLKRPGYKDASFPISVKQFDNRIYMFKLELETPEKGISQINETDGNELRIEKLETDMRRLAAEKESLSRDLEAVKKENARLLADIEKANRTIKEIQNLVK